MNIAPPDKEELIDIALQVEYDIYDEQVIVAILRIIDDFKALE